MTGFDVRGALSQAVALHRAGRLDEASELYKAVLKHDRRNADAHNLLGVIAQSQGQLSEALEYFERALKASPKMPSAHFNKGNALSALDRTADAAKAYRAAIAVQAGYADARLNLGVLLHKSGDLDQAITVFREMTAAIPTDARGHYNLGRCLAEAGDTTNAETSLRHALALDPAYADARIALAKLFADTHDITNAIAEMQAVLSAQPRNGELRSMIANWQFQAGQLQDAVESYKAAAELDSDRPAFLFNLGHALYSSGQLEDAAHAFRRAIASDAKYTNAYVNLGQVLSDLGDVDGAVKVFDQALAIGPQSPYGSESTGAALTNKALALLATQQYSVGWAAYRHRFDHSSATHQRRPFTQPTWCGESLENKTLLLWTDQGLGDEILYASMLPDVVARAKTCVLECTDRLVTLFQRSFPDVHVVGRRNPPDSEILEYAPDVQSSVPGLGEFFRPSRDTFSHAGGYLRADEKKARVFRERYEKLAGKRKIVGISWKSTSQATGAFKSLPVDMWGPIFARSDIFPVSLQYGDVSADLSEFRRACGVKVFEDPDVDQMADLDTYAAQVAAMDLVLSISNTAVHFAGALNVPVWTLVPQGKGALWYFRAGDETPWYPSMRLYRQDHAGDWSGAVERVASALSAWTPDAGRA